MNRVIEHYDMLVDERNDPVYDAECLRDYMDKWDVQGFIDRMHLDNTKSVMEIGVGTGRLAIRVAPRCKSLPEIDVSPKTIETAMGNMPFDNLKLICADFSEYQFYENFDIIYSSLTFMHIKNKAASLLADNGLFLLSIDKNQDEYIDMGIRKIKIYPDSPDAIRPSIKSANLEITEEYESENAFIFIAKKQIKNRC